MIPIVVLALAGASLAMPGDRLGAARAASDTLVMPTALDSLVLLPADSIRSVNDGPGALSRPAGIACDAFGRIDVSDAVLHRLQRYDANGAWLGEAGSLGSGEGQLRRPGAVAALGTLSIAVLDRENRRVVSYDLFGRLQGTLIDFADPLLNQTLGRVVPSYLAADRGAHVYVVDSDGDRLLEFGPSGSFERAFGGPGPARDSFRGISGVATGRHGELFVTQRIKPRVQRLDAAGRVVRSWPLSARHERGALSIAVDDSGRVAVADEIGGALWLFDESGRSLAHASDLQSPRALCFARDGSLLVAEEGRVRRFRISARAIAK